MIRKGWALCAATVLALVVAGEPLRACSTHGSTIVDITQSADTEFEAVISGYETFGYSSRHHCGCGLAVGEAVSAVTGVRFVDVTTGAPVAGFPGFLASSQVVRALEARSPAPAGTRWFGFHGVTSDVVEEGIPMSIVFTLVVPTGTSLEAVEEAFAVNRVGTGEVSEDGSEFIGHFAATQAGTASAPFFLRGDCDGDGQIPGAVNDAIANFRHCFRGQKVPCLAACDADGDGNPCSGVTDGLRILRFVFQGNQPPPAPFPGCGKSTRPEDAELGCERSGCQIAD